MTARGVARVRVFDLDDIGAEVAEDDAAARARDDVA
jgi:hypothetical protein